MLQQSILASCRTTDGLSGVFEHYATWTTVMDVCRHWRDVAVASPTLWSTIHVQRASYERLHPVLSLQRSSKCPLNVFLDLSANPEDMSPVLAQLPRVQGLHLEGDHRSLCSATRWAVHNLQALAIIGTYHRPDEGRSMWSRPMPAVFGGDLSTLHSLMISRFEKYPDLTLVQLRRLHISDCSYHTRDQFASLLRLLAGVPALEELVFTDTTFRDWSLPGRRVDLSALRKLAFERSTSGTAHLLKCLELPGCVSLSFDIDEMAHPVHDRQYLPWDLSSLHNVEDLTSFNVTVDESRLIIEATGDNAMFLWNSSWSVFDDRDLIGMSDLIDSISVIFSQATSLCLHVCGWHPDYLHQHQWLRKILAASTNVLSLFLVAGNGYLAQKLLAAFDAEQEDEEQDGDVLCPYLQELHVDVPGFEVYGDLLQILYWRNSEEPLSKLCVHMLLPPGSAGRVGPKSSLHRRIEDDLELLGDYADDVVVKRRSDMPVLARTVSRAMAPEVCCV